MPTSATKYSVSEALELALRAEREPLCFVASEIVETEDTNRQMSIWVPRSRACNCTS